jgi:hypothetical protein
MTPSNVMGHMKQRRQYILSTNKDIKSDMEDEVATPVITGDKSYLVYAVVLDQRHLYTDFTGIITVRSSKSS